jgi:hypothetical protein
MVVDALLVGVIGAVSDSPLDAIGESLIHVLGNRQACARVESQSFIPIG